MPLAVQQGLPGSELPGDVHVAVGDHRKAAVADLIKEKRPAGHLPRVELLRQLLPAVPKVVGLLLGLSRGNRVRGDRHAALTLDRPDQLERIRVGVDEFGNADSQDMGRSIVRDRVLAQLEARDHDHAVTVPRPLGFGFQNLEIEGKGGRRERLVHGSGRLADQRSRLAKMIRDGDRAETERPVHIDQLGDGELPVAEDRVHVEIGQKHSPSMNEGISAVVRVASGFRHESFTGAPRAPGHEACCDSSMSPHSQAHATTRWIGAAPQIEALRAVARRAEAIPGCILISGEKGTGRGTLARLIHEHEQPGHFHCLECECEDLDPDPWTRPEVEARPGSIQLRGIDRLPMVRQRRLLEFLRKNPRGRIISTTREDLRERVREGRFKEELYYRLAAVSLVIPPLRCRREDIPLLARHFLEQHEMDQHKMEHHERAPSEARPALTESGAGFLSSLPWDGNVAELKQVMTLAATAIFAHGTTELDAPALKELLAGSHGLSRAQALDESEFLKQG